MAKSRVHYCHLIISNTVFVSLIEFLKFTKISAKPCDRIIIYKNYLALKNLNWVIKEEHICLFKDLQSNSTILYSSDQTNPLILIWIRYNRFPFLKSANIQCRSDDNRVKKIHRHLTILPFYFRISYSYRSALTKIPSLFNIPMQNTLVQITGSFLIKMWIFLKFLDYLL